MSKSSSYNTAGSKGLEPGTRHGMSGSKATLFSPLILELHSPSSLLLLAHLSCFFLCRDDFPASLAHDPNVAFPFLFMFFQFKCPQQTGKNKEVQPHSLSVASDWPILCSLFQSSTLKVGSKSCIPNMAAGADPAECGRYHQITAVWAGNRL